MLNLRCAVSVNAEAVEYLVDLETIPYIRTIITDFDYERRCALIFVTALRNIALSSPFIHFLPTHCRCCELSRVIASGIKLLGVFTTFTNGLHSSGECDLSTPISRLIKRYMDDSTLIADLVAVVYNLTSDEVNRNQVRV